MSHSYSLRLKSLFFLSLALSMPSLQASETATFCQISEIIPIERFNFRIQAGTKTPKLNTDFTASELKKRQDQFFSNRSSPFMRRGLPPALGFYEMNMDVQVKHEYNYSKTIDGRFCGQVTGATVFVTFSPEYQMAKELLRTGCVSQWAIHYQSQHHDIVTKAINEINTNPAVSQEIKDKFYPAYNTKGPAGASMEDIKLKADELDVEGINAVASYIIPSIFDSRRNLNSGAPLDELHSRCNGLFGTTATDLVE